MNIRICSPLRIEVKWSKTVALVCLILTWFYSLLILFCSIFFSILIGKEIENFGEPVEKEKAKDEKSFNIFLFLLIFYLAVIPSQFVLTILYKKLIPLYKKLIERAVRRGGGRYLIYIYEFFNNFVYKPFEKFSKESKKLRNYYIQCFRIFEYLYFALSIAGIALAIEYPKTGAFISLASTVEQKILEKMKDYLVDKELKVENRIRQLEEIRVIQLESQVRGLTLSVNSINSPAIFP